MIIDFAGGINESQVQEMINESLSFTASVINLTNASAEEIKTAFANPDGVLCLADYSGMTYFEQYRSTATNGNINIYYYVAGVSADSQNKQIYDRIYRTTVTPSTGEVSASLQSSNYVPDIIYDLDQMNAEQLMSLNARLITDIGAQRKRFSATWTYNGKRYNASVGYNSNSYYPFLMGMAYYNSEIYYDRIEINNKGVVTHTEYTSNIVLTPVQE